MKFLFFTLLFILNIEMSYSFSIFKSSNDYKSYSINEIQSELKSNGLSDIQCDSNNKVRSYSDNIGFFRYDIHYTHEGQNLKQIDFFPKNEEESCATFSINQMKVVEEKIRCRSRRFEFNKEAFILANEHCNRQLK